MSSDKAITNHRPRTSSSGHHADQYSVPVRSETFDVYVIRERYGAIQFLQLQPRPPSGGCSSSLHDLLWMPIVGRLSAGETVVQTAIRVLREQIGFPFEDAEVFGGFWACAPVLPFFVPKHDCIVLSPRFLLLTKQSWEPAIDAVQFAHRWKDYPRFLFADKNVRTSYDREFDTWPGQCSTVNEVMSRFDPFLKQGDSRYPFIAVGLEPLSEVTRE